MTDLTYLHDTDRNRFDLQDGRPTDKIMKAVITTGTGGCTWKRGNGRGVVVGFNLDLERKRISFEWEHRSQVCRRSDVDECYVDRRGGSPVHLDDWWK